VHGIERTKNAQGSPEGRGEIRTIVLRYSDGRVLTFVPDADRETFSEDDILELKKVLSAASSKAEWADINTRLGL